MSTVDSSLSKQIRYSTVSGAAADAETITKEDQPVVFELEETATIVRGEWQPPLYRDKWFGIAFWTHLGIMIMTASLFATGVIQTGRNSLMNGGNRRLLASDGISIQGEAMAANPNLDENDYGDDQVVMTTAMSEQAMASSSSPESDSFPPGTGAALLSALAMSLVVAPILAVMALSLMRQHAIKLIQGSLLFGIVVTGLSALIHLIINPVTAIVPAIFCCILLWYAKNVWHRIPFAAANVRTAITAVKANMGMAGLSLAGIPIHVLWWSMWLYVVIQTSQSNFMSQQIQVVKVTDDEMDPSQEEMTMSGLGYFVWILLLLSLYWTLQVIANTIHTTVAGTVGTWWFLPTEARNGCCNKALTDSLSRSMTYSFGSICMGSLVVAILQVARALLRSAAESQQRNARDAGGAILRCLAECLLAWIEQLVEYFNKWAFIYVGIYGYSYMEAGKNVMTLFRQRGWTTIISDSLVHRMIGMMGLGIGLVTALIAVLMTLLETRNATVLLLSALLALIIGIMGASVIFQVLYSAVDTIIVLFAEAPMEFRQHYPDLASEMEDAWAQAWPDIFTAQSSFASATTTSTAAARTSMV